MCERQQKERARPRTLTARIVWLAMAAALAFAQDAERGRCAPELEVRLDACQGGTRDVWHYTYQGRNDRQLQRSWPYKSRERAQSGRSWFSTRNSMRPRVRIQSLR